MVTEKLKTSMQNGSWVRKMFEEGAKMKAQLGAENVFDYSLGNPDLPPPPELIDRLRELADNSGIHGYMPNSGHADSRNKIASYLTTKHSKNFTAQDLIMTVGASGAINVALKTIVSPGDEVIVIAPYFMEYRFYIDNFGGVMVPVECKEDFSIDVDKISAAITPKTKAIILNSPNNPSGKIYTDEEYSTLAGLINNTEIFVISDEPYSTLVFDDTVLPSVFKHFKRAFLADSFSKSLSLAGERIGYLAMSPDMPEKEIFSAALAFANRTLGFVNSPSIFQKLAGEFIGVSNNLEEYKKRSNYLYNALTQIGYECEKPRATFYLFPKSLIPNDAEFAAKAISHGLIVVPGSGFGCPGYFRLSLCLPMNDIERSVEKFKALYDEYKL